MKKKDTNKAHAGFIYANASHYTEYLVAHIFESTRATNPLQHTDPGDRAWNDAGPKRGQVGHADSGVDTRPILRSIILDFSSVNNVDITSVQNLIDVRNQLDRHAAPDKVEWHFAAVNNRWTKRALAAAGFGYPTEERSADGKNWTPVFSVAHIAESEVAIDTREKQGLDEESGKPLTGRDSEEVHPVQAATIGPRRRVVGSVLRPFFHPDIDGALQSAIRSIEDR